MKWLMDLSTRSKLLLSFGLMILLVAIVMVVSYQSIMGIQASQKKLYHHELADALDIKDIRSQQNALRANLLSLMLVIGQDKQAVEKMDTHLRSKEINEILQQLIVRNQGYPERIKKLQNFANIHRDFVTTREKEILPLVHKNQLDEARKMVIGIQSERNEAMKSISDGLIEETETNARAALAESERMTKDAIWAFSILGVITLVFGITLTVVLTRILAGPMKNLSEIAGKMAAGDLTVNLPLKNRQDETGILMKTFNLMLESLRKMLGELSDGMSYCQIWCMTKISSGSLLV